jgi:hypothetical protein
VLGAVPFLSAHFCVDPVENPLALYR